MINSVSSSCYSQYGLDNYSKKANLNINSSNDVSFSGNPEHMINKLLVNPAIRQMGDSFRLKALKQNTSQLETHISELINLELVNPDEKINKIIEGQIVRRPIEVAKGIILDTAQVCGLTGNNYKEIFYISRNYPQNRDHTNVSLSLAIIRKLYTKTFLDIEKVKAVEVSLKQADNMDLYNYHPKEVHRMISDISEKSHLWGLNPEDQILYVDTVRDLADLCSNGKEMPGDYGEIARLAADYEKQYKEILGDKFLSDNIKHI